MRRYRFNHQPKANKRKLLVAFSILFVLVMMFVPGPNGLIKVIQKTHRKQQLHNEIENLKIKAELIESKIAKGQNTKYMRKYLIDCYEMVPKDSSK